MKRDEERQKLLDEVLNNRRTYSNIYGDSMDVLKNTESELNALLRENQKELDKLTSNFNYSDEDLNLLKKEIEQDFGVAIAETPKTVVMGKASKEVFVTIENGLKARIVGQDEACHNLCIAFRRPYIVGSDPAKIRNSIIVYGSNGTGRHKMVETMANLLKENGLTTNSDIVHLDMSRYTSSSQDSLFLQDLYVALNSPSPIVMVESFEEASPIYNRMLSELVLQGKLVLSKRYNLVNGQLHEASSKLTKDVIDTMAGNDKTLVFVTELKPAKMMDIFGKSFIDHIDDRIYCEKLSIEAVNVIIEQLIGDLKIKCTSQLETALQVDSSLKSFLVNSYEPNDGIDSIAPIIDEIYNSLVNLTLREGDIDSVEVIYSDKIMAKYNNKEADLGILEDNSQERMEIEKELNDIVGLKPVKEYLLSLEDQVKANALRKKKGLKTTEISKHMIFTGNPGTGKTTIARIVSRMMKACGILKQGQLVEVTRADLVGKYVGHTAPLTMSVIQSALGGVLFIDEAYSLYRGKDDSFGLEAIDTLVKAMEDHRDDLIVILAGYSKEMADFLTANSGLKSRFANQIEFPDYTGEELMLIAKSIAKGKDYLINDDMTLPLTEYFTMIQAKAEATSGNGRLARNVVEAAILKQSKRIMDNPDADLNVLLPEDFNLTL